MTELKPYWIPWKEMKDLLFSIRKEHREGFIDLSESPGTVLPFFSFAYLVEGELLLEIEGAPYICQGGNVVIVPPNTPFRVLYFKGNLSYECGFSPRILKDLSYDCVHSTLPVLQSFSGTDADFTASLLEVMMTAFKKKDMRMVASALDLFLCRIEPRPDSPGHPVVNKFLEKVFNRTGKPRKVSDYADELCITPNYLNRLVRSHTRHSAMEWIEISRLKLAKSLLKQNELPISEIAAAVGIDDQSYFTRFFKKNEGCTPSQFRDSFLKMNK